jgi:hypothetical protein
MQKRKLGNSNLEVSAIGLGCMGVSQSYGCYLFMIRCTRRTRFASGGSVVPAEPRQSGKEPSIACELASQIL